MLYYNVLIKGPCFSNQVISISNGIEEFGNFKWQLATSLFGAWVIVFLCLSKGVQTSGKVSIENEYTCLYFVLFNCNLEYLLLKYFFTSAFPVLVALKVHCILSKRKVYTPRKLLSYVAAVM